MQTDRCPYCGQIVTVQDARVSLTTGEVAHVICTDSDARHWRRWCAVWAWAELVTGLLFLWGGIRYLATGGVLCLAGAILLAWNYPERHGRYWHGLGVAWRRHWRRWWS